MSKVDATSADCGDSEVTVQSKSKDVIRLCMFAPPMTTAERLERTLVYVKDPEQYLIDQLGQETYETRKDLLCISPTYEKDIYGSGGQKIHFEQHIAKLLGKGYGLFFITGVQAQLAALKIHCDKAENPQVAWHVSAHLESAEERAFEEIYGLDRILLGNDPNTLPTIEEIKSVIELPEDQRPAVLLLELPNRRLGCSTYTYDELTSIASTCRANDVKLHLDGARLWEIEPYYRETAGKSFVDIAALFDTVYVSFYKGLGGVTGAILVTDDAQLNGNAKMWQRRAGGNPFTLMYETVDCERGYNENIGTFNRKWKKMNDVVTQITAATSTFKSPSGGNIVEMWPQTATCAQIRTIFNGYTAAELHLARDRTEEKTGIRVFEMLWSGFSLDEKMAADRAGEPLDELLLPHEGDTKHEIEWMIMSVTEKIDTDIFVEGYVTLCQELQQSKS